MLYNRILAEHRRLENEIANVTAILKKLPEGNFFCSKNGNSYKWYQTDGKKQTYLPKKKIRLAEKLAARKYYALLLEDLIHEKQAIEFYLRHHNSNGNQSEKLLAKSPEYQKLLSSCFKPSSLELREWAEASFEKNPKFPDHLIYHTSSGKYVRSKSEVLIDLELYTAKIPYRYEAALNLGGTNIYPDFTIRHPITGAFFYWEHFGLVDNPEYRQNMLSKLKQYTSFGIIPTVQLITTYETKEHPLTPETIKEMIRRYFL